MQQSPGVSLQENESPTFFLVFDLNVTPPDSNPLENEPKDLFSSEDTGAAIYSCFHLSLVAKDSEGHKSKPEYLSLQ